MNGSASLPDFKFYCFLLFYVLVVFFLFSRAILYSRRCFSNFSFSRQKHAQSYRKKKRLPTLPLLPLRRGANTTVLNFRLQHSNIPFLSAPSIPPRPPSLTYTPTRFHNSLHSTRYFPFFASLNIPIRVLHSFLFFLADLVFTFPQHSSLIFFVVVSLHHSVLAFLPAFIPPLKASPPVSLGAPALPFFISFPLPFWAATMHLNFGHVCAVLLFIICGLTGAGIGGPQFGHPGMSPYEFFPEIKCSFKYFLYESRTSCDGFPTRVVRYTRGQFPCPNTYDKLTTAYAFSISTCVVSFFGSVLSLTSAFVPRVPAVITVVACVFVFLFLTLTWPLSLDAYQGNQCDDAVTYKSWGCGRSWGMSCLIAAWCVAFVTMLLAILFGVCPFCTRSVVVVKKQMAQTDAGSDASGSDVSGSGSGSGGSYSSGGSASLYSSETVNAPDTR